MNNSLANTRHPFEEPVDLVMGGDSQAGITVNISRGGVFVRTDPLPGYGVRLVLLVELPGIPKSCSIPCVVRWVKPGEGIGLQFENLRAREVWALNKLLVQQQGGQRP